MEADVRSFPALCQLVCLHEESAIRVLSVRSERTLQAVLTDSSLGYGMSIISVMLGKQQYIQLKCQYLVPVILRLKLLLQS
jgi:hypothetical protein